MCKLPKRYRDDIILKRYSKEFIDQVVSRVYSGELSVRGAMREYDIGGKMTIHRWLDKYEEKLNKEKNMFPKVPKKAPLKISNVSEALEEANIKLELYDTIFELAEKEYGVDFKKILLSEYKETFKDTKN